MKYCAHCGAEIMDEAVVCVHCGCRADGFSQKNEGSDKTLGLVAKIFMIITNVEAAAMALLLLLMIAAVNLAGDAVVIENDVPLSVVNTMLTSCIACVMLPLSWCIPMTVAVHRRLRDKQPIGTALKVFVLLLCNVVSGILLLCMKNETPQNTN